MKAPPGAEGVKNALRDEEIARSRMFFRILMLVALITAGFIPVLEGPRWLRMASVILCSSGAMVCAYVLTVLRHPERYTARFATAVGVGIAILGVAVIYYIGPFSAGAMILTLGLYFFGYSRIEPVAWSTYVTVALLYFVASAGIASGLLPDLALFSTEAAQPFTRWFQVLMSQVIFASTFFLARSGRDQAEKAMQKVYKTQLELRRREALLYEARGELARANRPGEGRHTGKTVGAFTVGDLLGRGAMGEVYRARDCAGLPVAIKFLHPNLQENDRKLRRFLREAEVASKVESDNVPQIYATGWLDDGKTPYLAMEFLDGHDLGWHLRRTGRLELPEAVELVEHVAKALADVRDAGVVHRDLKPANVFLTDTLPRTWKVLDFGLSKLTWSSGSLTRGNAVGTPSYMSPEQVEGPTVDHQADLYALGALAYRALCGIPPFSGNEIAHVLYRVVHDQPTAPAELANIPIDIELVLALGMAKRREDRFHRVEDFARAMRDAFEGRLSDELRSRGWVLLKAHPWGSRSKVHRDESDAA